MNPLSSMLLRKQRSADFSQSKTSNEWMNGLCSLLGIHGSWFVLRAKEDVSLCDGKRRLEPDSRNHSFLHSGQRGSFSLFLKIILNSIEYS